MVAQSMTRYQPVENGYEIIGSREIFNRTLYGSHQNDDLAERYFTFAGDTPIAMGALTDWSKHTACHYAKSGVLFSGLALTPGVKIPHFYSENMDNSSRWFHQSGDVKAVFRNGWMEYVLRQFSPWFPEVDVNISIYPLQVEDGFLVHYRIGTDQRVIFCAGFGGLTDFIGRFEYPDADERNFYASDCKGNEVVCGENWARISREGCVPVWVGASFPVQVEKGDALSLQNSPPGIFLGKKPENDSTMVAKMSTPIGAGETLDGFIVVLRSENKNLLHKWLEMEAPDRLLRQQIYLKKSCISMYTPDIMLNQTVPPTVLAMDASWHKDTFCHGAHGYHAPFLGWRNWYGPTVLGWSERVQKAIKAHLSKIPGKKSEEEQVWYDGKDHPGLDHESSQYHQIKNSYGFIPCFLGGNDIYNMQEVAVDMLLYHLQWTGDLEQAKELFKKISGVLDWEERILDSDEDGLYQNFLNTWISDGHSYNGGGCAQASAYNYHANQTMAGIAGKLQLPADTFRARATKILNAFKEKLWLPDKGVIAEYVDTIGNKLVHPSPELSTIYLSIDCGIVDMFQAYRMLKFTETELRNERSSNCGRLVYSSNWLPKKYSTCGLFTAENICLSLAYFQCGQKEKALEILQAITDCYFSGSNPGQACHVLSGSGSEDIGDLDFTDVSSTYLRLIVEGLFGIRCRRLDNEIEISPKFPSEWSNANIDLKDISLNYTRDGRQENFRINCDGPSLKRLKIPLRSTTIDSIILNGNPVQYRLEPAVNNCFLIVETSLSGNLYFQVVHGQINIPRIVNNNLKILAGNEFLLQISEGQIIEYHNNSQVLNKINISNNKIFAETKNMSGSHTLFVRVKSGDFDSWLTADFSLEQKEVLQGNNKLEKDTTKFIPLDISAFFNCSLAELHQQEYRSPRPKGYSIGVRLNGRYAWEWNHCGHNVVKVDDILLRRNGSFLTPSGIPFATRSLGNNVACASQWDNFPTKLNIPLTGRASELAIFFIGVTNPMQCYVENVRITVSYLDDSLQTESLTHPVNFDDWLVPALQTENETAYFSDYNHGIVQRIKLDHGKELSGITIESIANEVIIGILGISIRI